MSDYPPTMKELAEQSARIKARLVNLPPEIRDTLQELDDALDTLTRACQEKIDPKWPEGRP
jgi:hypothetical protein